ncbi:MAG TPA: hypothetical protein VK003_20545 [Oceanobacillus sp.]|nr:hypothetical protein [Oceanobacillus sp.]
MDIRQAALDDTEAISARFRAEIGVWQRLNEQGRVEDVPYEALSVYERWLHGGAWMSVETGAIFLNHLLLGAGLPLVAVQDGQVVGYAEVYHNVEGEPFGAHLHVAHLLADDEATADMLLDAVIDAGKTRKCQYVTFGQPLVETAARRYELTTLACLRRYSLPARTGQVFYRAVDHVDANPAQIEGWSMPVGRMTSARHQWEILFPGIFETIPEMHQRKTHRLRFTAGVQDAFVVCKQQLYDPRSADFFIWTLKGLAPGTITALRDWAHREGYRTLWMPTLENAENALGPEAESDVFTLETHAISLR